MNPTRRAFLSTTALAVVGMPLTMAGSCTTTNGVTTVTVNVAQIDGYAKVGVAAVTTILSFSAIASAIGAPMLALISAAEGAVLSALSTFDNAVGGTLTFTLNNTSAVTDAKSVIAALNTLVTDLKSVPAALTGKIGTNDLSNVNTAVDGAEAALALIQTLLGYVSASANGVKAKMSEPDMFRAVGLPVPAWAGK